MDSDSARRRICVVTGSRAEYGRVKTLLTAIEEHPSLELNLIVTGAHLLSKYGESVKEIERDGFQIDERVHLIVEGEVPVTMAKSVGLAIMELATVYDNYRPDIVVAPTDRFETLATAIAAAMMNTHIAHIQGGEVTGTIDESTRHAITKFAHIHFPATEASKERIIRMGEDPRYVFNVGCPGTDLLLAIEPGDKASLLNNSELKPKDGRVYDPDQPYILFVQHPVTTEFGHGYEQIQETVYALQEIDLPTIMLWPNPDAGHEEISAGIRHWILSHSTDKLFSYRNFSNETFVRLMNHAACMVGNSSAGIRESCYFGLPVVNIGSRQKGRERGKNVMDVWYDRREIVQAIRSQLNYGRYPVEPVYGEAGAGKRMAEILATVQLPPIQKQITY
jgi:UDP-hydrolysing UDP-N-acetyl-D-glucosamine 2-epimerase